MKSDRKRPSRVRVGGDRFHPVVPDGAAYVGRAAPHLRRSPWHNPHQIGRSCRACGGRVHASRAEMIDAYRQHLREHPELVDRARAELAGRDLACWCALDVPCHADVLLAVLAGEEP